MDCLHDFDEDLRWVLESCNEIISAYPPAFRRDALHYLQSYDVFSENFNKNYICYVLPFWLRQAFLLDRETSRVMSLGNIFGFFYFLVQDAVMDAAPGEYRGDLLPLGNLFLIDFMEQYRKIFPSRSPFWQCLKKYFGDWAQSVAWEREEHWKQKKDFTEEDMRLVAHKAAPLKITAAAACLLSGKEREVEPLSEMLDYVLITSQLLDDWSDWREDQACGNCTYFLRQVMKYCGAGDFAGLSESQVGRAVYAGDILDRVFALAGKNHTAMKAIPGPDVPYLTAFHESLLEKCRDILLEIHRERNAMLQGGFAHWLYKTQEGR